jgi:citrate synthase
MATYIGAGEAARVLGITKPTLYAYVSRGVLERRTAVDGRTSLYSRDEVEALAARGRRRGPQSRPTIDVEIASAITELQDEAVAYRGHDAAGLASTHSFEAVAELLWTGTLTATGAPWRIDRTALALCRATIAASGVAEPIATLALAATTLGVVHAGESGPAAARRLLTIAPSLLGGPLQGDMASRLSSAWVRRPSPALVDAVSRALVLLADHELATSTLAVRVACSVRVDAYAAIATGLQVATGPLHGAAAIAAADLLADADTRGAGGAVEAVLSGGRRLPGFGHAVYRNGDPRFEPLMAAVRRLGGRRRLAVVDAVLAEAGTRVGKHPNIDFALAALAFVGGLPFDAPLLAVARIAGWGAHFEEECAERPVRFRGLGTPR